MSSNYILKLNSGKILCFYYDEANFDITSKTFFNNKWSQEKCVFKNARRNYTITLQDEIIYLFCQDLDNNIVLCTNKDDNWSSKIMLRNQNNNQSSEILIHPLIDNNELSLIYNTPSPDNKNFYLVLHKFRNGKWDLAARIDEFKSIGSYGQYPYVMQRVSKNHVILFYQTSSVNSSLGYREVTPNNQGKFNLIHSTSFTISDVSFLTTSTAIHIVYIIKNLFASKLVYIKKESDFFSEPVIICEAQKLENCLIQIVKDDIYVTWMNNNNLWVSTSYNKGNSFKSPQRYKNKFCLNPIKATFISQNDMSENNYYCREIYVDESKPWDIQMLPELLENFYEDNTEKTINVHINNAEQIENDLEHSLNKLKNQLNLAHKQLAEKHSQIMHLTNLLKTKNDEIVRLEFEKRDYIQQMKNSNDKGEMQ